MVSNMSVLENNNIVDSFLLYVRNNINLINYKINRIHEIVNNIDYKVRKETYKNSVNEYKKYRTHNHRIAYKLWDNPEYVIINGVYILHNNNIIIGNEEFDFNYSNEFEILKNINIIKMYITNKHKSLDQLLYLLINQLYGVKS